MSGYFETGDRKPGNKNSGNKKPGSGGKFAVGDVFAGMVNLDHFFDGMEFKPGVMGDTCFKDPDPYQGQFVVRWDQYRDDIIVEFYLSAYAADGPNFEAGTSMLYLLNFFGDGFFTGDVDPHQLAIGEQTSMVATEWLLTSDGKGKLKKFTCTGASTDSDTDSLVPFDPVVTITIKRIELE